MKVNFTCAFDREVCWWGNYFLECIFEDCWYTFLIPRENLNVIEWTKYSFIWDASVYLQMPSRHRYAVWAQTITRLPSIFSLSDGSSTSTFVVITFIWDRCKHDTTHRFYRLVGLWCVYNIRLQGTSAKILVLRTNFLIGQLAIFGLRISQRCVLPFIYS